MASLQHRNGSYRVIFRYHGKQQSFTLGEVSQDEAEKKSAVVDYLLLQPEQEIIDDGGFLFRLVLGNFAQSETLLFSVVTENDAITAVAVLKRGHVPLQCHCNAVTKLLPHSASFLACLAGNYTQVL